MILDLHVYNVRVVSDSVAIESGCRLMTMEMTYPRFIHAELMTHRLFSRNSASSRAIPTQTFLDRITNHPVMPISWGRNCSGMQAKEVLDSVQSQAAEDVWREGLTHALYTAKKLHQIGVHKQIANRPLEPYAPHTVLVSSTEWDNFFHLRDSEFAQPEIQWVARETKRAMEKSVPTVLQPGQWHLPLVSSDPESPLYVNASRFDDDYAIQGISAGRCARVSYLTHDGKRDPKKDLELFQRLVTDGHWSPLEHVAMAMSTNTRWGNFFGFKQFRKFFDYEHFGRMLE